MTIALVRMLKTAVLYRKCVRLTHVPGVLGDQVL